MGRRRSRNRILVPEAREELNEFKNQLLIEDGVIPEGTPPQEVAYRVGKEIGVPIQRRNNRNLTAENAGKVGGQIGGRMVRELVKMAQEQLVKESKIK